MKTLSGHTGTILGVRFSPNGQMIASASKDKTVRLWKSDGTLLRVLTGHTDEVVGVDFSADNKILATASLDGTVKLWSAETLNLDRLLVHGCGWLQPYFETNINVVKEEYKQCRNLLL